MTGGRGGCQGWGLVPPGAPGEISEGRGVPAGLQIKCPSAGDSKSLRTAGNQLRLVQTVCGKERNVKIQDSQTHIPLSQVPCYVSVPILEKEMAPHSSTLAWKTPWTEEPGRLQSMGSHKLDMTERLHFILFIVYGSQIAADNI